MRTRVLAVSVLLALLALPPTARAQGVPGGAADGYEKGDKIAGPIGAIIGAAVGGIVVGVVGGVSGVLGIPQNDRAESSPPPRRRQGGRSGER